MYTDKNYVLKLKHYKNSIQYTYYQITNFNKSFKIKHKSKKEDIERCSLSRSSSLLKEYILNNDFDYFFTLTIKYDFRNDINYAASYINNFIKYYQKLCKRKNIDFKYIYVFEKQKKGGLHLHGFFKGFFDLYKNEYNHLSSLYFDNIGFQNFQRVDLVNPFYLIKYIEKEPIKELNHKFFRSRGLNRCKVEYFHDNIGEFKDLPYTFGNSFCKMFTENITN